MNAVITGGSKGIGKALAEKFAANGYNIFLSSRNRTELSSTANELQEKNPSVKIFFFPADLGDKQSAKDFGNWIIDQKTSIDILINNAGYFIPGSIYNEDDGVLEKMISVNLYAAYNVTRTLIPKMIEQRSGHIFNISSIAALKAYANGGSYSISKYALMGFSKNLRQEMIPHNIKVTTVYPGAVFTDSWAGSGVSPKRIMEVNDIAETIYAASQLSPQACIEDIVIRPVEGDLP